MPDFDLLSKPWIPVLWKDGKTEPRLGIKDALERADEIREVHGASPLDTLALYRFLLAVLKRCAPEVTEEDLARIGAAGALPRDCFKQLDKNKDRFELLGSRDGFYQEYAAWKDVDAKKDKPFRPPTDLVPELPSASNVAHFRHTRDFRDGLCPACCAVGLIRLSAFATHSAHPPYKGGKPSGINGGTPVYALYLGRSLLDTLLLNWPKGHNEKDRPGWMGDDRPNPEDIGCLAGLTWRPRKVWLERPQEDGEKARCIWCGMSTPLVRRIAFLPGWERPFGKKSWALDPHLRPEISLPNESKKINRSHAQSWRLFYRDYLQGLSAAVVASLQRQGLAVAFFASAANEALYKDAVSLVWRLPSEGLNKDLAEAALAELGFLEGIKPDETLEDAMRPEKRRKKVGMEIQSALTLTGRETEAQLRREFERFVDEMAAGNPDAARNWRNRAQSLCENEMVRVHGLITTASPLRRDEEEARFLKRQGAHSPGSRQRR